MNALIPEVQAGQQLSAKWLNEVVTRVNRFSLPSHSFQAGDVVVTRPFGAAGSTSGTVVAASQFALVTQTAEAAEYGRGEYGQEFNAGPSGSVSGQATLLYYVEDGGAYHLQTIDPPAGEYGEWMDDQLIWIWCMSDVSRLMSGDFIEIFSPLPITPGLYIDGEPSNGPTIAYPARHVHANEFYHRLLLGGGIAERVLYSGDGEKTSQEWAGHECPDIPPS